MVYHLLHSFSVLTQQSTSTKKNGKWGLQLRIMIPASGDVTLAGAKIN